ncbi:MAG: hypothetical protein HYY82_12200 [Deltaproteobacteria bacterium]|nr:hypothetical protein [Deltaproteobacteria bacterium]
MNAASTQKARRQYRTHGHFQRVKALRYRGVKAINGRTRAGREAKRWGTWAMAQKGNGSAPLHTRQEIELATLDLWLLLELGSAIVEDARKRGAVLNQRRKELPRVHDQYNQVSIRFSKRCEALELDRGPGELDLARRLQLEAMQKQSGAAK